MKYYNSYLSIAQSPSSQLKEDYQQVIDSVWEVSSSIYDIGEETIFGTQNYCNVNVRINHAVDSTTGTKLGDDFKQIKFQDFSHARGLGYRYTFNNNTWMCTNTDLYKFVTASTTVRRCNNILKWYDDKDVLRQEPCIIDYEYGGTSLTYDKTINVPNGNLYITAQYNDYSKNIQINDRFLFGGQAYKVKAVNNFFQDTTGTQSSVPLVYIQVFKDSIINGDDVVNNIPTNRFSYSLTLNAESIVQSIGYTSQLVATVKLNDEIVSEPITWSSSNSLIATVSNSGLVTLITNGTCTIYAKMQNNLSVSDSISVTVQAIPTQSVEIRFSPIVTELLQGTTQTYTVYEFINGIQQVQNISIMGSGASMANYMLNVIDGNTFSVKNLKTSSIPLTITGTSGLNSGQIVIKLKGVF